MSGYRGLLEQDMERPSSRAGEYSGLLEEAPGWHYNELLPMRVRKGEWEWALPGMLRQPILSWMKLREGMGSGQIQSREGTEQALPDILSVVPFGGALNAPKSLAKTALKRYHTGYDPPPATARHISQDYPLGPPSDEAGRLTASIDGAPLHASFIAGRRSLSGGDQGLGAEQIVGLAKALTAGKVSAASQKELGREAVGVMSRPRAAKNARETSIRYLDALEPDDVVRVIAHESGHAIDDSRLLELGSSINVRGLQDELSQLFDVLNNPMDRRAGKPARHRVSPTSFGYDRESVQPELIAEAIRAYLTNPTYIKSVAPNTARRIREQINTTPELSRIVQFNEAGGFASGSVMALDEEGAR